MLHNCLSRLQAVGKFVPENVLVKHVLNALACFLLQDESLVSLVSNDCFLNHRLQMLSLTLLFLHVVELIHSLHNLHSFKTLLGLQNTSEAHKSFFQSLGVLIVLLGSKVVAFVKDFFDLRHHEYFSVSNGKLELWCVWSEVASVKDLLNKSLPVSLIVLLAHLVIAHVCILGAEQLVFCVKLLELFTEGEVLLLKIDGLEHSHVGDLLQSHRVDEQAWIVRLALGFGPWLDAPDEVELASKCFCFVAFWHFAALFSLHLNQWFSQLFHQVCDTGAEFAPNCLRFCTSLDWNYFFIRRGCL